MPLPLYVFHCMVVIQLKITLFVIKSLLKATKSYSLLYCYRIPVFIFFFCLCPTAGNLTFLVSHACSCQKGCFKGRWQSNHHVVVIFTVFRCMQHKTYHQLVYHHHHHHHRCRHHISCSAACWHYRSHLCVMYACVFSLSQRNAHLCVHSIFHVHICRCISISVFLYVVHSYYTGATASINFNFNIIIIYILLKFNILNNTTTQKTKLIWMGSYVLLSFLLKMYDFIKMKFAICYIA